MGDIVERIRELNSILHNSMENSITLRQFCDQLSEVLQANIYFFYPNGLIFSYAISQNYPCKFTQASLEKNILPPKYKSFFDGVDSSVFNIYEKAPSCTCENVGSCIYGERYYSIVPIYYYTLSVAKAGMLLVRYGSPFEQDEEVLCEYTAIVVSLELFHQAQNSIREDASQTVYARIAVKSLSKSELTAIKIIMQQIDPNANEGVVILAKATAIAFVSQSVATSALKKLESAGVLSTVSYGVKGKYIRIKNKYLLDEIYKSGEQQ